MHCLTFFGDMTSTSASGKPPWGFFCSLTSGLLSSTPRNLCEPDQCHLGRWDIFVGRFICNTLGYCVKPFRSWLDSPSQSCWIRRAYPLASAELRDWHHGGVTCYAVSLCSAPHGPTLRTWVSGSRCDFNMARGSGAMLVRDRSIARPYCSP